MQALLRAGFMNREDDLGQLCLLHTQPVDPCQEQRETLLTSTHSTDTCPHKSQRQISLKGENRLRRGLTLRGGEMSLRLPAPAQERKLVLLLQLFGSSFTGYTRAAGVGAGETTSASLGSLPWVFWWHTGTAVSRLHPFTSRLLHKRMGA